MKSEDDKILREIDKDSFRQNLSRYTWQAYHLLPQIKAPFILDAGCGTGVPAVELAVLSRGWVTAVDTDKAALALLREKAKALDLTDHIKVVKADIKNLKCKKASFDIVWCEGSISAVGFEKGLQMWRCFLKPGGFMVVHDEIKDYKQKIAVIPQCGYRLIDHFIISADIWLCEYFKPLEERINELRSKYSTKPHLIEILNKEGYEIELFKSRPHDFASVFYIMRSQS
jgi:ubiquinone/menaquinone biosynthesis C-methylase UbiE